MDRDEARKKFEEWKKSLPHCIGDSGGCDGDLVGEEHEDNCPMKGKEWATFEDAWMAAVFACEQEAAKVREDGELKALTDLLGAMDGLQVPKHIWDYIKMRTCDIQRLQLRAATKGDKG